MNKYIKTIISIFLTVGLSYGVLFAINLSTVNPGDSLTNTLWNDLIGIVNTNSGKLEGVYNVGGNIGIGTTNPSSMLHIEDKDGSGEGITLFKTDSSANTDLYSTYNGLDDLQNGSFGYGVRPVTNSWDIWEKGNNLVWTNLFTVINTGNVGIGTSAPASKLHVAGTITETSDERLKVNILKLENSLEKISKLSGVKYEWKDKEKYNSKINIGVLAQDIEKEFPEAVNTSDDGYKSVEYSHMIAPLIEAVKELKLQNEELRVEIELLKNK